MMADTILTLRQIEDFYQDLTTRLLGLNSALPVSQKRVRVSWPTGGAPGWKIDEDVTFLSVMHEPDPIAQQMDVTYRPGPIEADRIVTYTRVYRVGWICYGPNSFEDADRIRSGLYLPDTKMALARSNLALVPDAGLPVRSPELYSGRWWERVSYSAKFNELVTKHSDVPYIESADWQIIKE